MDFLEAVHKLAEKPYIIVGLHFDQVSLVCAPLHLCETFTGSLAFYCTFFLCSYLSGGESLQREKLSHHECPRENAQRPGLSSRFFYLVFPYQRSALLVYLMCVYGSLCVSDFCFLWCVFFFTVCVRSGDRCTICSHQRFAGPFQGRCNHLSQRDNNVPCH